VQGLARHTRVREHGTVAGRVPAPDTQTGDLFRAVFDAGQPESDGADILPRMGPGRVFRERAHQVGRSDHIPQSVAAPFL